MLFFDTPAKAGEQQITKPIWVLYAATEGQKAQNPISLQTPISKVFSLFSFYS